MDMKGRAGPVAAPLDRLEGMEAERPARLRASAHEPQLRDHAGVLAAVSDAEQDALPAIRLPQSDRDRLGMGEPAAGPGRAGAGALSPPPPAAAAASVAQQRLEQVHGAHVDALSQLVSQGADAHSLKHTGSALRARQQLGLAAAGDALTDESDHVVIAPPSQAEVDALERLGYGRSQAAFICMVDGLMRQGFSAEEAQTHLVKASARALGHSYLQPEAGSPHARRPGPGTAAESGHGRQREICPRSAPRAPVTVALPTSSLREKSGVPAPAPYTPATGHMGGGGGVQRGNAADAEGAAGQGGSAGRQATSFAKIRRAADERDLALLSASGLPGRPPRPSRWDLASNGSRGGAHAQRRGAPVGGAVVGGREVTLADDLLGAKVEGHGGGLGAESVVDGVLGRALSLIHI